MKSVKASSLTSPIESDGRQPCGSERHNVIPWDLRCVPGVLRATLSGRGNLCRQHPAPQRPPPRATNSPQQQASRWAPSARTGRCCGGGTFGGGTCVRHFRFLLSEISRHREKRLSALASPRFRSGGR
ncbi:hypothetical protein D623_10026682 [Myotis brandtii]|uniref:Uncharacterized protein n=1 Tax=Myotis brandtii TaxID=109478 RepID=S7MP10_MYOBR|nr:hypothetical protein D623_10026682 [Myotis brandtii]